MLGGRRGIGKHLNASATGRSNGGFIDAYDPNNAVTGTGLGLGQDDILQFENLILNYGNVTLNPSAGDTSISVLAGNFNGNSGSGVVGDVALFDYFGNKMFVIDGDGSQMPDGGDIFFDVDDSITSAKYDSTLDAFTFA